MMLRSILPVLALLATLASSVGGEESAEVRTLRTAFRKDFAPSAPIDVRQRALDVLGACRRAEAVPWFGEALDVCWKRLEALGRAVEEAREALRKFEEPIYRDMLRAQRGRGWGGVPRSVQVRWEELRQELHRAASREAAEWELVDRTAEALGRLLADLPGTRGPAAIRDLLAGLGDVRDPDKRAVLISALGRVPGAATEEALVYLLLVDPDPRTQVAVVRALGRLRAVRGIDALIRRLEHPGWSVRVAAAEALGNLGPAAAAAVEPLIAMLAREDGRPREDAAAALARITGRRLGPIPGRWHAWLEARRKGEEPPAFGAEEGPDGPTFYGITTLSKRIVFVLDRSGSMREPANPDDPDAERTKLAVAARELRQAVSGMPEDGRFNVVIYHHAVERFDPRRALVDAGVGTRKSLDRFLERRIAEGATNIHDALEAAFRLGGLGRTDREYAVGVDTIFFLTDGVPTHGKIQDPDRILAEARRWNRLRRIKVHVVGVGRDVNEGFLRELAEQSGGQYVAR
jgi:hypothetical protein